MLQRQRLTENFIEASYNKSAMTNKLTLPKGRLDQLIGQQVTKVVADGAQQLTLQFAGGSALSVTWQPAGLHVQVTAPEAAAHRRRGAAVLEDRGEGLVPAQRH